MTSLNIKKNLLIIWVDEKIDGPENKRYLAELGFKENYQNVNNYNFNNTQVNLNITDEIKSNFQLDIVKANKVDQAIVELKKYKFREIIIITSGKLFIEFVTQFNKNLNDIFVIPKIIIFTSKNRTYSIPENIPNHKFYFFGGITTNFSELKNFIELQQKELDKLPEVYPSKEKKRQYDVKFLFSHIGNVNDLIYTFFQSMGLIISEIKYDNNYFINNILNEYKNEAVYYSLLNYIKNIPDIPSELLAKYYPNPQSPIPTIFNYYSFFIILKLFLFK